MTTSILTVTAQDGISTITMHDIKRHNVLGTEMLTGLIDAFDTMAPDTRVVILKARDEQPVWCAGFDIRALSPGFDPLARDGQLQALFSRIAVCPAPVIAMVRGSTWGGGTDLALRCDMIYADTSSRFAFTPARLGLPYDAEGLLNVLLRAGPAIALEMFATAEPIEAERALAVGLINHLVTPGELEHVVNDTARRIAANAPLTVSSAKRHLRALASALPLPATIAQSLAENRSMALTSSDYAEGLAAFAAKRGPSFTGR